MLSAQYARRREGVKGIRMFYANSYFRSDEAGARQLWNRTFPRSAKHFSNKTIHLSDDYRLKSRNIINEAGHVSKPSGQRFFNQLTLLAGRITVRTVAVPSTLTNATEVFPLEHSALMKNFKLNRDSIILLSIPLNII